MSTAHLSGESTEEGLCDCPTKGPAILLRSISQRLLLLCVIVISADGGEAEVGETHGAAAAGVNDKAPSVERTVSDSLAVKERQGGHGADAGAHDGGVPVT